MDTPKKIALIVNGVTGQDPEPETLESILAAAGEQVDVFDVHSIQETRKGFALVDGAGQREINPQGYDAVARVIRGARPGDTEKSWALQKFFEAAGAAPHISVEAARRVTDKILCRKFLSDRFSILSAAVTITVDDTRDADTLRQDIEQLGAPPYAVRKSIGSGSKCLNIVQNAEEALQAVHTYKNPPGENPVPRGALIHTLPPMMSAKVAERYGLHDVAELEKCSHHFRVVVVNEKIFSAHICYSKPGKFGLNPAQGASFHAFDPELLPEDALTHALYAASAMELPVAAIDITFDSSAQACVLDMNASPDLSQVNHAGLSLKHAFATSIRRVLYAPKAYVFPPPCP